MKRLDEWFANYAPILASKVQEQPEVYAYPVAEVPNVCARLRAAIERGRSFRAINKDSPAIKATCKALGIKHTYTAIDAWLVDDDTRLHVLTHPALKAACGAVAGGGRSLAYVSNSTDATCAECKVRS